MRQGPAPLPDSVADSPLSARLWLALAAGLGAGVCGYAGLYPQFDDGKLRAILGLTSVPFAAAVVAYGVGAATAARAFGRTLVSAAVLGMASTVIPALVITWGKADELAFGMFFGAFFGAGTGLVYGVPLAILASVGHRHLHAQTHAATDRASRVAGVWLVVVAALGLLGATAFDPARWDAVTETMVAPSPAPALVACAAALAAALAVTLSSLRLRRRAAWIERVRAGLEPAYRIRAADPRDRVDGLPRLGQGLSVVELRVEELADVAGAGSAYRSAATGTAVAIVEDDMCTIDSFTVAPTPTSASATSG